MPPPTLLQTFNFAVQFFSTDDGSLLGDGAFQDVSGLEIEMDVKSYDEGGRNDGVVQRVGRGKYQKLVCKRGMFAVDGELDSELWRWIQEVLSGVRPVRRYDGSIRLFDASQQILMSTWVFERGLPAKIVGPAFDAKTGQLAIEEIHIAHEGMRLDLG